MLSRVTYLLDVQFLIIQSTTCLMSESDKILSFFIKLITYKFTHIDYQTNISEHKFIILYDVHQELCILLVNIVVQYIRSFLST